MHILMNVKYWSMKFCTLPLVVLTDNQDKLNSTANEDAWFRGHNIVWWRLPTLEVVMCLISASILTTWKHN